MTYRRQNQKVNTFGMLPRVARRVRAEASGNTAVRAGRNAGGPCPAVCLATLTGWTYERAHRFLSRECGFMGAGAHWEDYVPAFGRALGQSPRYVPAVGTCATTVSMRFAGASGAVRCRGHVMPVLNGRLLNAGSRFARMACAGAVQFDIV